MFGTEKFSVALRLASVIHAVHHIDHYIEMVWFLQSHDILKPSNAL